MDKKKNVSCNKSTTRPGTVTCDCNINNITWIGTLQSMKLFRSRPTAVHSLRIFGGCYYGQNSSLGTWWRQTYGLRPFFSFFPFFFSFFFSIFLVYIKKKCNYEWRKICMVDMYGLPLRGGASINELFSIHSF